jgi:hypothetical protein
MRGRKARHVKDTVHAHYLGAALHHAEPKSFEVVASAEKACAVVKQLPQILQWFPGCQVVATWVDAQRAALHVA